jgi:TolB protein
LTLIVSSTAIAPHPKLDGSIATVRPDGQLRLLLRPKACCELQSVDWAPSGRQLAFALGCMGCGPQAAPGIYLAVPHTGIQRRIQDGFAYDLDWSPDGSRLAYVTLAPPPGSGGSIHVINANGSDPRLIETGTAGMDSSPSWSPDGTQLAFATEQGGRSYVSVIDLDGSHRLMIAADASAPAWSPNGKTIAVSACGGIKLITPSGTDVTPVNGRPECPAIGVAGEPIWSPNGRKIAIGGGGIYKMDATGANLTEVTRDSGGGFFHTGKPTWRPRPQHPGR